MTIRFGWPVLIAAFGFLVVAIANVAAAADASKSGNSSIVVADQDNTTVQSRVFSASENFDEPE